MGAGQASGAVASGKSAVWAHVGETHQRVGYHGDIIRGHQRDVIWGAALT